MFKQWMKSCLTFLVPALMASLIAPGHAWSAGAQKTPRSAIPSYTQQNKHRVLQKLYLKLQQADGSENAQKIEKEIEDIWSISGSPDVDRLMTRTLIAHQKNEYKICLKLLDKITKMAPDYIEGWNRRALIHFEQDHFALAMIDIRHVLSIDPHNYQAINGLGLILREVGKKKAALKVFKKLLRIHPHYSEARKAVEQLTLEINGQDT